MKIEHDIPLSSLTTLRVGGLAPEIITIEDAVDIPDAVNHARKLGLPWAVIAGGSNILATDEHIERCVFHMKTEGIEMLGEDEESLVVRVQAGEMWNTFVAWTVECDLWGVENLAGIPGTVGATPVQNVGAYGIEIADVITLVTVFDTKSMMFSDMSCDACVFGYRDSIFKHPEGERFIIASVTMRLSKRPRPRLSYKDVAERFKDPDSATLRPRDVAHAIIEIRANKFPDLTKVGTAGSFFKNPLVSKAFYEGLTKRFPGMPGREQEGGVKLPLAWVLDNICYLKGHRVGAVALFERQPLVLVAYDGATARDIDAFANDIAQRVYDATGITIEREVRELK